MLLGEVLKNINKKHKKIRFSNIKFDSRDCKPNDLFFAISGNNSDGNRYIKNAIKNGARIIVTNSKLKNDYKKNILFIYDKIQRKLISNIPDHDVGLFGNTPGALKPNNIIAVTGTNGKTSVANFYQQILTLNNKKVSSIGTLGVLSKKIKITTNNTTIDPVSTHKILQDLKKSKIENVILEASSHGLKQHRLNNIKFKTAIFTNLSRDHLDYHKTFKDYLNSKLILFNKLVINNGNTFGSPKSFIRILKFKKLMITKKLI